MTRRAQLIRWYWHNIRRYEGECCHSCGTAVAKSCPTYWFAPNWLWNHVIGGDAGIRCIRCFTFDCERAEVPIGWTCDLIGDVEEQHKYLSSQEGKNV